MHAADESHLLSILDQSIGSHNIKKQIPKQIQIQVHCWFSQFGHSNICSCHLLVVTSVSSLELYNKNEFDRHLIK